MTTADTAVAAAMGADSPDLRDLTPDHLLVTAKRADFFAALRPGDVLLFQGADFLAGLAQLTERRTCYHSAIYLGEAEREPGGPVEHLMAHNVSTLWWRDLARELPNGQGELNLLDGLGGGAGQRQLFEKFYGHLEHHYLRNPFGLSPAQFRQLAHDLVDRGGVGAVTVDSYLDRVHVEELYSEYEDRDHPVRHVRSVVALRHRSMLDGDQHDREADLLAAAKVKAADATGFSSAELLSVVPECLDRPGYSEWHGLSDLAETPANARRLASLLGLRRRLKLERPARDLLKRRLRQIDPFHYFYFDVPTSPGWICASYVIATYAEAKLPLTVGNVKGVKLAAPKRKFVDLSTPRDLWDCYDLEPIALFVRGPERWVRAPGTGRRAAAAGTPDKDTTAVVVIPKPAAPDVGELELVPGEPIRVHSPANKDERAVLLQNARVARWELSPDARDQLRAAHDAAKKARGRGFRRVARRRGGRTDPS